MHKSFSHIGEFLKECHFKGSDNFFHKAADSYVILVQLSGCSDGTGFTVTYGLHPIQPNIKRVHHRDYLLENCVCKGQVLNSKNKPVWDYHMSNDALAILTKRLLGGIAALETKLSNS